MIQLSGLTKRYGDRTLLDGVTWQVTAGERVGLCGPNGAGKTTLLRMLAGLEEADGGAIIKPSSLTVGYLPQDGLEHEGLTLEHEVSLAFQSLLDARIEIDRIEHALADPALPGRIVAELSRALDAQGIARVRDLIGTIHDGRTSAPSDPGGRPRRRTGVR